MTIKGKVHGPALSLEEERALATRQPPMVWSGGDLVELGTVTARNGRASRFVTLRNRERWARSEFEVMFDPSDPLASVVQELRDGRHYLEMRVPGQKQPVYVWLREHPAGAFASRSATHAKVAPRPVRPLDALAGFSFLAAVPQKFAHGVLREGSPAPRGADILRRLEARGYTLRPAGAGGLLVEGPPTDPHGVAPLLALPGVIPLLRSYLNRKPAPCEHPDHKGKPSPGWTVSVGGAIPCEACAG